MTLFWLFNLYAACSSSPADVADMRHRALQPGSFPGYSIHETSMDGNCLFEAIADQLDRPASEAMACRQEIVDYIRSNIQTMVIIISCISLSTYLKVECLVLHRDEILHTGTLQNQVVWHFYNETYFSSSK